MSATGRRAALRALGAGTCIAVMRPCAATPAAMRDEIAAFTGGAAPRDGGIRLDMPELVENGNSVPLNVEVDSPMTEREHVRRIAVFSEKNPQPQVVVFRLSPRNGRARVATRMRMADTQRLTAVAEMSDGSFRQHTVEVLVTLAACLE